MAKINLPTKKRPPLITVPSSLMLFSEPKVGKTSIAAQLPDCLIADFEKGAHAVEAMSVDINSVADVHKLYAAIKEAGFPYKFLVADTVSAIEDMCLKEAEYRYANSPDGKKDNWILLDDAGNLHPASGKSQTGGILNLGYGKGYNLVNDVFNEVMATLKKCAPRIILMAHSVTTTKKKNGKDITSLDIMLGKKARFSATFRSDAIGYVYRKKDGQNWINFTATDDILAGNRFRYLEKEHILISEFIEDGDDEKLVTYWEKIFSPKKEKSKPNPKKESK
jgi:hypothetical protein